MVLPFCNREFDLNKLENTIHFLTNQPGFASLKFLVWFLVLVWVSEKGRGVKERRYDLFGRGEREKGDAREEEDKVGEKKLKKKRGREKMGRKKRKLH